MTAAEYRKAAHQLINRGTADLDDATLRKAQILADLAISAAISETGKAATDGE